jgi:flagellar protein FliS
MTASPVELIIMLFDSCIKNLRLAEICLMERKDISGASEHFIKAQKIILELTNCLDTRLELSIDLIKIYDFLLYAIRQMNIKKDLTLLPDVLEILISFRDTWQQAKSSGYCSSEVS